VKRAGKGSGERRMKREGQRMKLVPILLKEISVKNEKFHPTTDLEGPERD